MGFGLRIFIIDKDDKIKKIPLSRFERIHASVTSTLKCRKIYAMISS